MMKLDHEKDDQVLLSRAFRVQRKCAAISSGKPETTSGTSARFKAMAIEAPLLSPEEKRKMIEILSA